MWQSPIHAWMSHSIQSSNVSLEVSPKLLQFPEVIRTRENYLRYKGDPVKEGYTNWERVVQ